MESSFGSASISGSGGSSATSPRNAVAEAEGSDFCDCLYERYAGLAGAGAYPTCCNMDNRLSLVTAFPPWDLFQESTKASCNSRVRNCNEAVSEMLSLFNRLAQLTGFLAHM